MKPLLTRLLFAVAAFLLTIDTRAQDTISHFILKPNRSFYVEPETYGAKRESEPPVYVSTYGYRPKHRNIAAGSTYFGFDFRNRT